MQHFLMQVLGMTLAEKIKDSPRTCKGRRGVAGVDVWHFNGGAYLLSVAALPLPTPRGGQLQIRACLAVGSKPAYQIASPAS